MSALRSRTARLVRSGRGGPERSLLTLVQALLLLESAMYSAVAPVLPHYAHTFGASKTAIGVLAAAYPAGLIPGAIIGGAIGHRIGPRRTAALGLFGFGLAVIGFGFGSSIPMLDALRFVQGGFCGLIWGGALTWLIHLTPGDRRARTLGAALAAATFGTLFGPIIGTVAVALGTELVFGVIGVISIALAVATLRRAEPSRAAPDPRPARTQLAHALRISGLRFGVWLIMLEAITFGAETALLPLRLSQFGASGATIGAVFVLGSALSGVLATTVGGIADRRGPYLPLLIGLLVAAPLIALLVVPQTPLGLGLLMIVTFGGPLTFAMIPGVAIMTDSAERAGVALVLTTTLFNLAFAVGESLGAPLSASVAQATSDLVPLATISLLMVATAGWAFAHRRRALGQTVSVRSSTPSSSAAAATDISTYRSGVCSESPSTMCTASPSVSADSRSATAAGSDTDHSPVSQP